MVASSRIESLALRYDPYIEELREFFSSRNVPFGTPASLVLLLEHLQDPAFHEEMVSMVRSILYREEALSRIALMEVIAVAAGGVNVGDDTQELHHPMRELLAFVQEVARAKRGHSLTEPSSAEPSSSPASFPEPISLDLPSATHAAENIERAADTSGPLDGNPTSFKLTNDKLSRSLMYLQHPEEEPSNAATADPFVDPKGGTKGPDLLEKQRSRRTLATLLRRSYWIPGVVVLLLAVATGLLLERTPAGKQGPAAPQAASVVRSTQTKPSAYGEPLPRPGAADSPAPPSDVALTSSDEAPAAGEPGPLTPSPRKPDLTKRQTSATRSSFTAAPKESVAPLNGLDPREGVFLASSGAMASHLLSAPAPGYPKFASLTRTEGQVIVQVVVGRDGRVEATRVLEGPHLLRGAAEHAIHQWRYRPYLLNGHATDVATIVTVSFRLR